MRPYALIAAVVAAMTVAPTASSAWVTSGEVYRVWLDGRRINLTASPADDVAPAVSPDGRQVAFASDRGGRCQPRGSCVDLYVVGSDGRDLRRVASALPPTIPFDGQIAWSPDGKRLTYASGSGAVYVITVGRTQQLVARRSGGPSWSADGRVIALVTGDWRRKHVVVVTPGGRRVWRARGTGSGPAGRPEWSPTGRIAVISRLDGTGRRILAHRTPCHDLMDATVEWFPDNRSLIYDFKCQPDPRP